MSGTITAPGDIKNLGETEGRRDGDGAGEINDAGRRGADKDASAAPSQRERWSIFTTFFLFLVHRGAEVLERAEFSSPLLQILPPKSFVAV